MSAPIDEHTAWRLLRAVPRGVPTAPVRVQHHPHPDVWLQVHPSGEWTASDTATPEARRLLDLFLPIQQQADLVIGQAGQSVDGRIATTTGHSHYVTGPADIQRLHRLRALVDAVVVGAGTIAADNPRLTVRGVEGNNPTRVILDPNSRLDAGRHVFSDGAARTIVVRRRGPNGREAQASVEQDVLRLPMTDDGFDPIAIVEALRANGFRRVLVEGGSTTISRFLQAGALDRLHVTVAPVVIGSGPPALTLDPIASLADALRPTSRTFQLDDDILFDLDLTGCRNRTRAPGRLPNSTSNP